MVKPLGNAEFETRTIGALVLTTPFLRRLGFAGIVDRLCPVSEQADMGHGVVAELAISTTTRRRKSLSSECKKMP